MSRVSPARNVRDCEVRLQGGGSARGQAEPSAAERLGEPRGAERLRPTLYVVYVATNFRQHHFEVPARARSVFSSTLGARDGRRQQTHQIRYVPVCAECFVQYL